MSVYNVQHSFIKFKNIVIGVKSKLIPYMSSDWSVLDDMGSYWSVLNGMGDIMISTRRYT